MERATALILGILVLVTALAGCSRSAPLRGNLTLALSSAGASSTGILIITPESYGLRWEMVDLDRDGKAMLLRSGSLSHGTIRDVANELKRVGPATASLPPPTGEYTLSVQIEDGDDRTAWVVRTDDDAMLDACLPSGGVFQEIWREATGIPKMFWYRDVGPYDQGGREAIERPELVTPAGDDDGVSGLERPGDRPEV
jgi:hypothetical protein